MAVAGMTFEQAQALLARITYKPGYEITLRTMESRDRWQLRVQHKAPNSEDWWRPAAERRTAPVIVTTMVTSRVLREEFLGCLYMTLHNMELHELHEWLRVDGRHYKDPHPEQQPTYGHDPDGGGAA
jgi:hypothetical protein